MSHSGFKGACDSLRNISDALMQAIATQALLNAGVRETQIVKLMGGNVRRFLTEHLPKS